MEYCLNCISPMKRDSKKLGKFSSWLVCPKCGYRTKTKNFYEEFKELDNFKKYKETINSNNLNESEL